MQTTTSPSRRRRWLIALLLVASLLVVVAKKFFDYSAAPAKDKESDFVYPPNADQTKPTTLVLQVPPAAQVPFEQVGGYINDASYLNKTAVYGIVKVTTVQDIQNTLQFARDHKLKVTAAGSRHSMGGHTFVKDGLVLDMRGFNQVRLDKEHKILNAQTGATWKQLQLFLDPQGLSVKAMQSINIFTVGGTLSVNAHGIAHNPGQVAPTVRSFRILLSNGDIKQCSPTENAELFHHALGGYGLMGIILDVDLDVVDNEMYLWKTHYLDYKDFASYYEKNVEGNPNIGLAYGRLSMSPSTFLAETAIHTYEKTHTDVPVVPLKLPRYVWLDRFIINFSKTGEHRAALPLDDGKIWRAAAAHMRFAQRSDEPGRGLPGLPQPGDVRFDGLFEQPAAGHRHPAGIFYSARQDAAVRGRLAKHREGQWRESHQRDDSNRAQRRHHHAELREAGHVCLRAVLQSEIQRARGPDFAEDDDRPD